MRRTRLIITGAVIGIIILIAGYIFYEKTFTAPFLSDKMLENLKTSAAEQNELAFMQPLFQPAEYPENDPLKNAYFGELHVHSSLSFDSYLFGNRLTIDQAYHFAKGTSMENAIGENMRLTRPLDFIAVTDHAESFGLFEACADSTISEATTESCQRFNRPNLKFFLELREIGEQRPMINPLEVDEGKERARFFANMTWDKIVNIADEHNEPGIFTAFAAYEYSPVLPESGKHHRNVIFRNSHVPKNAVSGFDALSEIDLWNMLSENCKDPCEFLTIPHNPNRTWGLAFASHTIDGDAYTIDDWKQRDKFEPLVEMFQVKGSSECSTFFGSTDEECNFEQFFPQCKDGEDTSCIHPTSMARDGLKKGVLLENEMGFNPLDFGMIGATDNHNSSPGDTEEWDYRGSSGAFTGPAKSRLSTGSRTTLINNPGGLAAVWSEENTRDSLFDAMQRKEVFATSGTRIRLRFFGSFNYQDNLADLEEPIETAYSQGYPMGSTINNSQNKSPTFFVLAEQDLLDAPLDKIQIIKGWTEKGELKEEVVDVVCSEARVVNSSTNECSPIDTKVDLTNCSFDKSRGAKTLKTLWTDHNYSPKQNAFYYARVIQNPTCRWSTYDSLRYGVEPPKDYPATITEMAWSSPIWIKNN